jgi:hypothetical protein
LTVARVTLVDSPEKMRPRITPSPEYSILIALNLRRFSPDASETLKENKEMPNK